MFLPERDDQITQLRRSELLKPQLDVDTILATQALAMGFLRHRARTKRARDAKKVHGFAFLETSGTHDDLDDLYDGSEEDYLVCRVEKKDHDQWRMLIRFRHNIFTVATKAMTTVEDYRFDWLKNGNNQAWASTTEIDASGTNGSVHTMIDRHPISPTECAAIRLRMYDMAEAVNPLQAGSIYTPLQK